MRTVAVVGCGKMGEAIVAGLKASEQGKTFTILATARRPERARALTEAHQIEIVSNEEAAERAEILICAVKPQNAREILPDLAASLAGKLLISICAGVTLAQLEGWLPDTTIIRAMPNTPALIREGMTVLAPGAKATMRDLEAAETIFSAVGRCRVLEEKHLDAVTALSGSGPAFACVVLESFADGGVMMGLPRDVAMELAAQTMQGAARLVLETGHHPAALKDQVTTPAGCTIAGLLTMEDGKIRSTLARTIQEATRIASGLGQS